MNRNNGKTFTPDVTDMADLERRHESAKAFMRWQPGEAPTEDGVIDPEITASKSGELYATGPAGAVKLKVLASGAYKDAFTDYLRLSATKGAEWKSAFKSSAAMKVLMEGADTAGGLWPPIDFRDVMLKKRATISTIRNNARVVTTGSNMTAMPKMVYTADDKYTSGARLIWVEEAPAAAFAEATNPVAGRVTVPVHVAVCVTVASRSLFEDSQPDLLGIFADLMGDTFGVGEEDAFWNGDGVGKPQGLLTHPNIAIATSAGGCYVASGSASAITWGGTVSTTLDGTKGLLGVDAALPPQYEGSSRWYFNKTTKAAIKSITDTAGMPLWATMFADNPAPSLMGYYVERAQMMPDIASNSYPVALGDMSGYTIADRTGMSVQVLGELKGLQDEVVILARERVGGQLTEPWKIRVMKIATS